MATIDTVAAQVTALQSDFDAEQVKIHRMYAFVNNTLVASPETSVTVSGEGEYTPGTAAFYGGTYQDIQGVKVNLITIPARYGYRGVSRKFYEPLGFVALRDQNGLWQPPEDVVMSGQGLYCYRAQLQRLYYNLDVGVEVSFAFVYTKSDQP